MGISFGAILCYGMALPEGVVIPWLNETENGELLFDDIEDWWLEQCGYVEPEYTTFGEWYQHKKDFLNQYQIPIEHLFIEVTNTHILAIPYSVITTSRGMPGVINKLEIDELDVDKVKAFASTFFNIDTFHDFNWYLIPYIA